MTEIAIGPNLPSAYLKIEPHPSSEKPEVRIVPLSDKPSVSDTPLPQTPVTKAYAPFQTLADFQYAETAVVGTLSKDVVNQQLAGLSGPWIDGKTHITFCNYNDMRHALEKACDFVVKVSP